MSPLSRLIRVVVISIIDPPLGESVRVAQNDRAGLRGYVQFNKYTHTPLSRLIRRFGNKYP